MCKNSNTGKANWDDFRAFLAVARIGRLTVAARRLGMDHSTLSRRIAGLEAKLQIALFERSPAGFRITAAGRKLMTEAQQMENAVIRIQAHLEDEQRALSGPVRLTFPEGFSNGFFVSRLHLLRTACPELSVELIAEPSIVSLSKREADIAIMMDRPTRGPLVSRKLCDYEYGLYGSQSYLDAHPGIRSLADLPQHFIIGYIPDLLPTPAHDYLKDFLPGRDADFRASNILSQADAAASGLGLAVLPCFIAAQRPQLTRLLTAEVCFTRSYWLVAHEETRFPARTNRVKDFIIGQVRDHAALFRPSAIE